MIASIGSILSVDFNTSHVSINLVCFNGWFLGIEHFNTSHVSINLLRQNLEMLADSHFNTSHVSINPAVVRCTRQKAGISIHLMFLLIVTKQDVMRIFDPNFNTSYVSIYLHYGKKYMRKWLFQYISCFY